jgi:hypothetical protein
MRLDPRAFCLPMLMLIRTAPLNPRTKEFCARIRSGARPKLMVIQPEPGWEPNYCFFCVRERVRCDGGRIHLGWAIWEWPGVDLEAERHAVFAPADDSPGSISRRPLSQRSLHVFSFQTTRQPNTTSRMLESGKASSARRPPPMAALGSFSDSPNR